MNLFEDLVIELKQENLLEDTVIDIDRSGAAEIAADDAVPSADNARVEPAEAAYSASGDVEPEGTQIVEEHGQGPQPATGVSNEAAGQPSSEREYYKKRAAAEVSSLQMVEHILSAVEREYSKKIPRNYDDLEVKKALAVFLLEDAEVSDETRTDAERVITEETAGWCSTLAARDRSITVADLRRYCENCRPMLSSQAMLSLARFYRNLPYSEPTRGKFDFIITRLFSRPLSDQTRKQLFARDEMAGHIRNLYADWASVSLYNDQDAEMSIELTVLSFAELTEEAEKAISFDDLIKSDFFGRLRLFKESIAELFYAPEVAAAAIECNIRIGNVYVELIDRERERADADSVHERYSFIDNQVVSEAAGRSLELADLLRTRESTDEEPDADEPEFLLAEATAEEGSEPVLEQRAFPAKKKAPSRIGGVISNLAVNKWLIVIGLVLVIGSVGVYVWANFLLPEPPSSESVERYDLQSSPFRNDLRVAKISSETFYGVLQPGWETMTKEKQEDLLNRIRQAGGNGRWINVNLMNMQGRTVAFASPTRLEIYDTSK